MAQDTMARFFKPRHLPAVIWNPKTSSPFFEFSPEGFYDTDNEKLIAYMETCGYRRLTKQEIIDSDAFIAERMRERGEDQTGFVQEVPMPDGAEDNPEDFRPVGGSTEQQSPPEVNPVQGGEAASSVPAPDDIIDDDFEELPDTEDHADAARPIKKQKKQTKKSAAKKVRRRKKA